MSDWLTILPPVVAILIVLWKREVILALIAAIATTEVLIEIQQGFLPSIIYDTGTGTIERIVDVFSSPGNTRILVFSLLVGALLAYMRSSGGVTATVNFLVEKGLGNSARRSRFLAFFTGVFVFIESNLSVLMSGIISRGLFDKFHMSRARLAYIIDSTSAPVCILLLLNGWGAYVLGLLGNYPLEQSLVSILIQTIPLNFYALFTLGIVVYTCWFDKTHGPLKRAEEALEKTNTKLDIDDKASHPAYMLVPLIVMCGAMVSFMFITGNGSFTQGSGSKSVLYATIVACLTAYGMMTYSRNFTHHELTKIGFNGMSELLPLVSIVLLSLALGASLKELGTGAFVSGIVAESLPLFLVPALLFIAGGIISFTTGTSWGTFAILIPIGMPLVINLGLPAPLLLAAILGGGVFGDHCSPISDTTAVTAVASGCDLLEHVHTQLPYALVAGCLSIISYLVCGLLFIGV